MQPSKIHLPLLYPIITAILLALATGCSQVEPPPPTAQPNTPATPIPASPTSVSSPATSPEPDPFSQALDTAMSAATITQSAVSPDDWNLVLIAGKKRSHFWKKRHHLIRKSNWQAKK